jgi:excisionase family DNA binding protein
MDNSSFPSVLTLEQAADYLQLGIEELRAELESGKLPGTKLAGKWRISREALERLLHAPISAHSSDAASQSLNKAALQTETVVSPVVVTQPVEVSVVKAAPPKNDVSVQAAPSPTKPAIIAPTPLANFGRVRAQVLSYNFENMEGFARLPDGRAVHLRSVHFATPWPKPFPGYTVEFDLQQLPKGKLEARNIRVLPKAATQPTPTPKQGDNTQAASALSVSPPSPVVTSEQVPAPIASSVPIHYRSLSTSSVNTKGSAKAQALYQKAAIARTEGRIEEARKLFKQAIEAGASPEIHAAFFSMEKDRSRHEARRIIQEAIAKFPDYAGFYDMYGQMERRARDYVNAEKIFREGLARFSNDVQIRRGLAQTLVQIGTEASLREAGELFHWLELKGRLKKDDGLYQRFRALQRSPRANKAYEFFRDAGMRVGRAGRRDLPSYVTDIVAETNSQELNESFGLSGAFLVRCFQRAPAQIDIRDLGKFLRRLGPQGVLGLQDREVVVNSSVAFMAIPNSDAVRDQVMAMLAENYEAIVPLDDAILRSDQPSLATLRDLLGQYLGLRNLYDATMPVAGRRFFGREKLLLQLTDEVLRGNFLGIYGLRKMGKTSLIYQLRDEKLRSEAVAYVDLQASAALTIKNCNPLYWELERDLYIRLREQHREAADLLRLGKMERFSDLPDGGERAALLFAEDLRTFLDMRTAGKIAGIKRLIIVLDELERILPIAGQPGIAGYIEFFGLLRGLAQTERYRNSLSSIVVAANAAISERGYWEGRENPVFALYKPMFLPPLTQNECVEMIRTLGKGMSVYWTDEAIQAVFTETGGHPFLTRSLCSRIVKQNMARPLNVSADMVQAQIGPFIRDESDKLEQITELLRINFPDEEKFLQQIALDETSPEMADESLRHLLGYQLIKVEGSEYRMTLNLLRRWLRRRAGVKE